ncbi:MAG: magnesium/cobalt transporter CorA [Candidatus Diapherotrites archaeon]|nr:magnesium/cobalt transporter CorA [Candidatus Diapherotrites archaeon]
MNFSIKAVKKGVGGPVSLSDLKARLHEYSFVWADAQSPSIDEMAELGELFNFHYLSIESALSASTRSKIADFSDYIFFTFFEVHFEGAELSAKKIAVFFGKNFIVTVHNQEIHVLKKLSAEFEKNQQVFSKGPAFLLYSILDRLIDSYFPHLDQIADKIDALENEVFQNVKKQTLTGLFQLKRRLVAFRRIVNPQMEIVIHLNRADSQFIPKEFLVYFNDLANHLLRISESTEIYHELISDATNAYLILSQNKLNEIIKILTIISTIFLPLMFVTSFYGMNVEFFEYGLFGRSGTYFFAIAVMVLITAITIYWFRKKRWI